LDRRHVTGGDSGGTRPFRSTGVGIRFRGTAATQVVGIGERVGLAAIHGQDDAKAPSSARPAWRLQAIAAATAHVRRTGRRGPGRLQHAVRAIDRNERLELGLCCGHDSAVMAWVEIIRMTGSHGAFR